MLVVNKRPTREYGEQIRRFYNDCWMRVATIQLQALNRENQLNARIAELEQAEDDVPEDPNPENEIELPVEIVDEKCEGIRHDDDDVADNLPEIPMEAAVARVENGQN
ncbi:unnamed protein product [Caenorhabditis brenneri]